MSFVATENLNRVGAVFADFPHHRYDLFGESLLWKFGLGAICGRHRGNENSFNFVPVSCLKNHERRKEVPEIVLARLWSHGMIPKPSAKPISLPNIVRNIVSIEDVDTRFI
ncbi:MAG: hypothetical protein JWQ42_1158 [Edaphobacter sp.]|nr:hypothetical protein [Edaphobacter sp.]